MSHTTTLRGVKMTDVAAIRSAVADLKAAGVNCDLLENAKPRMYYGNQHGKCPFVLKLHDSPYDVGFDEGEDGEYLPVFDEWDRKVANQIGASCPMPDTPEGKVQHQIGQFMQNYSKHAAINAATMQGYVYEGMSEPDEEGNIELLFGVPG